MNFSINDIIDSNIPKKIHNYEIENKICEIPFGNLYLGINKYFNEKVFIKIYNKFQLMTCFQYISYINNEIHIIKKINHKNILQLYEFIESKFFIFVIYEHFEGDTLQNYLIKKKKINEHLALKIFYELIMTMNYLHNNMKLCHLNLNLDNILIDENYNIKISNFYYGSIYQDKIRKEIIGNNYLFSPPEILGKQLFCPERADVYSCGVILYNLLTGFSPFSSNKDMVNMQLIMKGKYNIPNYINKNVQDLIHKMMEYNQDKRIKFIDVINCDWFNENKNIIDLNEDQDNYGINIFKQKYPIDDTVLKICEILGINTSEISQSIENNNFNIFNSLYKQIVKYCKLKNIQTVNDFDSQKFKDYLNNDEIYYEESKQKEIIEKNMNDENEINKKLKLIEKKLSSNNFIILNGLKQLVNNNEIRKKYTYDSSRFQKNNRMKRVKFYQDKRNIIKEEDYEDELYKEKNSSLRKKRSGERKKVTIKLDNDSLDPFKYSRKKKQSVYIKYPKKNNNNNEPQIPMRKRIYSVRIKNPKQNEHSKINKLEESNRDSFENLNRSYKRGVSFHIKLNNNNNSKIDENKFNLSEIRKKLENHLDPDKDNYEIPMRKRIYSTYNKKKKKNVNFKVDNDKFNSSPKKIEKKDEEDALFKIERKRIYSTFSKRDKNNKNNTKSNRFKIEEEKDNLIPNKDKSKSSEPLASNIEDKINKIPIPNLKVEEISVNKEDDIPKDNKENNNQKGKDLDLEIYSEKDDDSNNSSNKGNISHKGTFVYKKNEDENNANNNKMEKIFEFDEENANSSDSNEDKKNEKEKEKEKDKNNEKEKDNTKKEKNEGEVIDMKINNSNKNEDNNNENKKNLKLNIHDDSSKSDQDSSDESSDSSKSSDSKNCIIKNNELLKKNEEDKDINNGHIEKELEKEKEKEKEKEMQKEEKNNEIEIEKISEQIKNETSEEDINKKGKENNEQKDVEEISIKDEKNKNNNLEENSNNFIDKKENKNKSNSKNKDKKVNIENDKKFERKKESSHKNENHSSKKRKTNNDNGKGNDNGKDNDNNNNKNTKSNLKKEEIKNKEITNKKNITENENLKNNKKSKKINKNQKEIDQKYFDLIFSEKIEKTTKNKNKKKFELSSILNINNNNVSYSKIKGNQASLSKYSFDVEDYQPILTTKNKNKNKNIFYEEEKKDSNDNVIVKPRKRDSIMTRKVREDMAKIKNFEENKDYNDLDYKKKPNNKYYLKNHKKNKSNDISTDNDYDISSKEDKHSGNKSYDEIKIEEMNKGENDYDPDLTFNYKKNKSKKKHKKHKKKKGKEKEKEKEKERNSTSICSSSSKPTENKCHIKIKCKYNKYQLVKNRNIIDILSKKQNNKKNNEDFTDEKMNNNCLNENEVIENNNIEDNNINNQLKDNICDTLNSISTFTLSNEKSIDNNKIKNIDNKPKNKKIKPIRTVNYNFIESKEENDLQKKWENNILNLNNKEIKINNENKDNSKKRKFFFDDEVFYNNIINNVLLKEKKEKEINTFNENYYNTTYNSNSNSTKNLLNNSNYITLNSSKLFLKKIKKKNRVISQNPIPSQNNNMKTINTSKNEYNNKTFVNSNNFFNKEKDILNKTNSNKQEEKSFIINNDSYSSFKFDKSSNEEKIKKNSKIKTNEKIKLYSGPIDIGLISLRNMEESINEIIKKMTKKGFECKKMKSNLIRCIKKKKVVDIEIVRIKGDFLYYLTQKLH